MQTPDFKPRVDRVSWLLDSARQYVETEAPRFAAMKHCFSSDPQIDAYNSIQRAGCILGELCELFDNLHMRTTLRNLLKSAKKIRQE